MASSNVRKGDAHRPQHLHVSKSFSRSEPSSPATTRNQRASTVQNGAYPAVSMSDKSERKVSAPQPDVYEKSSEADENMREMTGKLPADFDELPIELVALADRLGRIHPLISAATDFSQLH